MAAGKVYDYILVFKSNGHRLVNLISQMMLLLAVAVFSFSSLLPFTKSSIVPLILSMGILAWWYYVYSKSKKGIAVFFRIALLLAACGWWLQPKGIPLAIIYMLAALLEKQVKFPQEVAFDEQEIVFNSFPKKHYNWDALANVVLKDGLLTIDFMTNKLIQKPLESFPSIQLEEEFNSFCRKRLALRKNQSKS